MADLDQLQRAGDFDGLLGEILSRVDPGADANELYALGGYLSSIPQDCFSGNGFIRKKIAFLSGYTTRYFAEICRLFLLKSGIQAEVHETEYGLFRQAILGLDPALKEFRPDLVYFCTGSDHLSFGGLEAEIDEWVSLLNKAKDFLGCELVMSTFSEPAYRPMGNFSFKSPESRTNYIRGLNAGVLAGAGPIAHFHDFDFLSSYHGRPRFRDEGLYALSKVPVAYEFWSRYCADLAGVFSSVWGRSRKCLVLDLDNTLWGGIVGDDGIAALEIGEGSPDGESFKAFQEYVKELKERGVILAICSKNDESTVRKAFHELKEMPLQLEDFSAVRINWDPKHSNIAGIAEELNIGIDSLVFVDDNPAEREQVRRSLPRVEVIELPSSPSGFVRALAESACFETVSLTAEDKVRSRQYRENRERERLMGSSVSYEDYLAGLEMSAEIRPFDEENLPRIVQLINKTNQFNFLTVRVTDSEIRSMISSDEFITFYARLRDRFGDNGLVSCLVIRLKGPEFAEVANWVMSCRVLKRGLEHALLVEAARALRKSGVKELRGSYIPTEKNSVVAGTYEELGFELQENGEAGVTRWRLDLSAESNLKKAMEFHRLIRME